MATPRLKQLILSGSLGELFIDVRSAGEGSARPAIVGVHGFKGFKDWGCWPVFAERAARAGFTAVTFNLSGSGVDAAGQPTLGERFSRDTYSRQLEDIRTVLVALCSGALGVAEPSALGLVGHSRGGGLAILAAEADPRIRALVTWAAIAYADRWSKATRNAWRARGHLDVENSRTGQVLPLGVDILDDLDANTARLDISAAASRLSIPWLIVHGEADESVPVADAERLAQAKPGVTTLIIPGAGHTFGASHPWKPPVPMAERVMDETLRFMMRNL
jgi:pimeloyl-ACP methyl ester carboxylesterase